MVTSLRRQAGDLGLRQRHAELLRGQVQGPRRSDGEFASRTFESFT